jgi:hypothetical protein
MAIVYKGNLTVFGSAGTTDLAGAASLKAQGWSADDQVPIIELKNEAGEVVGIGSIEKLQELEMDFIPIATVAASAAGAVAFPAALAAVVTSGFTIAALNGTWAYIGSRPQASNEAPVKFTVRLRKYANVTLGATLT